MFVPSIDAFSRLVSAPTVPFKVLLMPREISKTLQVCTAFMYKSYSAKVFCWFANALLIASKKSLRLPEIASRARTGGSSQMIAGKFIKSLKVSG